MVVLATTCSYRIYDLSTEGMTSLDGNLSSHPNFPRSKGSPSHCHCDESDTLSPFGYAQGKLGEESGLVGEAPRPLQALRSAQSLH